MRAAVCTTCFGSEICFHGRVKGQCRDCAEAAGKTLARDKKCPKCDQRLGHCKTRGCRKTKKYKQRKAE